MAWVEWRSAGPSVATEDAAGACCSVEREAGLRFAGELAAGIVLRDEFHVAVFGPAIGRLILDANVGQFEVAVDNWQVRSGGKRSEIRLALLEADVHFKVVKDFLDRVRVRAVGQDVLKSLTPDQAVLRIVRDEMIAMLGGGGAVRLQTSARIPSVVLMAPRMRRSLAVAFGAWSCCRCLPKGSPSR
jgi:hypothetical protein